MALLTAKQVAERLSLNERTVKNMANRGEITGIMVTNAWRFDEGDVEEYIARQRRLTEEKVKQAQHEQAS